MLRIVNITTPSAWGKLQNVRVWGKFRNVRVWGKIFKCKFPLLELICTRKSIWCGLASECLVKGKSITHFVIVLWGKLGMLRPVTFYGKTGKLKDSTSVVMIKCSDWWEKVVVIKHTFWNHQELNNYYFLINNPISIQNLLTTDYTNYCNKEVKFGVV